MPKDDKVEEAVEDLDDDLVDQMPFEETPSEDTEKKEPESPESDEEESEERQEEEPSEEEPEEEPEEKADEEPEEEFDPESIEDPTTKAYVESLLQKVTQVEKNYNELRTLQGKQARELGVAREITQKSQEDFQAEIGRLEEELLNTYSAMHEQAEAEDDPVAKARIRAQAEDLRLQKRYAIQEKTLKYANDREAGFLKASKDAGQDYYSIQPDFDKLCKLVGHNPVQVKITEGGLETIYPFLMQYQRGGQVDQLVEKARKDARMQAAKIKNAASAPASSKTKPMQAKPKKDESGTSEDELVEMFGNSGGGMDFKE